MINARSASRWARWLLGALLLAALLLAGCAGRPAQPSQPRGVATNPSGMPAGAAVLPQPIVTQADEGGVTTDEPALASAPAAVQRDATYGPAPASGEAVAPVTTVDLATQEPEPTLTLPAPTVVAATAVVATATPTTTFPSTDPYPLQIEVMRRESYSGSELSLIHICRCRRSTLCRSGWSS